MTQIPGGGGRGRLYLTWHRHHHHLLLSCITMGSHDSHFTVSLFVRIKETRRCLQTTTLEERGELQRNRTEVLLASLTNALPLGSLGNTGAHISRLISVRRRRPPRQAGTLAVAVCSQFRFLLLSEGRTRK